ncbi:hypothetical protein [Frankia sp. R82]|uniref:hypothetical protein n=1 Tax=Frankia sp. R82 TaxID=2950553 RepID=UPI0020447912|nr:hypothetical protein [Frankia sp. R82]MCM3884133.1 hypothetical protein [Frankia sp. R82]
MSADQIPADLYPADTKEWTDLGFTLGRPVTGNPLFRHVTLPNGWAWRESDSQPNSSTIVDERGLVRVAVERSPKGRAATASLINVGYVVATVAIYNGSAIPWATLTRDEQTLAAATLETYIAQSGRHPEFIDKHLRHAKTLADSAPMFPAGAQ